MKNRCAFTMIELVFVIVILGILAAVAVPKFAATRDDAYIAKARSTIAAVQSAIVTERQQRLFRGQNTWITSLHANTTEIFDGNGTNELLKYSEKTGTSKGKWSVSGNSYTFNLGAMSATFDYNASTGTFACASGSCNLYE